MKMHAMDVLSRLRPLWVPTKASRRFGMQSTMWPDFCRLRYVPEMKIISIKKPRSFDFHALPTEKPTNEKAKELVTWACWRNSKRGALSHFHADF